MRVSDRKNLLRARKNAVFYGILLLVSIATLVLVYIFRAPPPYYEVTDFAMGTRIRVVVASEKVNPRSLAKLALSEFKRLGAKFDPYDPRSVLYKINHSNTWVRVDEETFAVVEAAVRYARITDGAFDPTLGRLVELWGFSDLEKSRPSTVPSDEEISEALKHTGYENVELDREKMAIRLKNGVWLDLGGIVKGYALDRAFNILKNVDGNATGFIDAGGDIRIIGPKYGKLPWTIGIRDPLGPPSKAIDYVYLREGAIATSGDYERFFVKDGVRYHHILDPKTGYPARGSHSVTVISKDAVVADVLATAGFVMAKDWRYVLVEFPKYGAHVLMVLDDGEVIKDPLFKVYEKKR